MAGAPVPRSIPAQAGEPCPSGPRRWRCRVYPRAGGGTAGGAMTGLRTQGLSPRRRGNRVVQVPVRIRAGSIPAQAGEPSCDRIPQTSEQSGLSPRRRGNHFDRRFDAGKTGSIPAQAGEPMYCNSRTSATGVYPRAGGGTPRSTCTCPPPPGLSPRRRGNPLQSGAELSFPGSIPAQAGEPQGPCSRCPSSRVYPRAGGGTVYYTEGEAKRRGLSPRRRGNLGLGLG